MVGNPRDEAQEFQELLEHARMSQRSACCDLKVDIKSMKVYLSCTLEFQII